MRVSVVVILAMALLPATAVAQPPGFEVVQPDTLALVRDGFSSKQASVWVRNSAESGAVPEFSAVVEDGDGKPTNLEVVLADQPDQHAAGTVERYRLSVRFPGGTSPTDVNGQLVVGGAGAPGAIDVALSEKPAVDRGVEGMLLWPLLPAFILIAIAGALATRGPTKLSDPLPGELSFKDSYASQVTAVGALLGTIVAAGALPTNTTVLSKQGLVALSLIFGVGIAVAALAYSGFQRGVWVDVVKDGQPTGRQQRKMQATVVGFLAASWITLWAAIGQLAVVWALVDELGQPQAFGDAAVTVLKVFLAIGALILAVYTVRRIPVSVASERARPTEGDTGGPTVDDRTVEPQAQPLERMSLL